MRTRTTGKNIRIIIYDFYDIDYNAEFYKKQIDAERPTKEFKRDATKLNNAKTNSKQIRKIMWREMWIHADTVAATV